MPTKKSDVMSVGDLMVTCSNMMASKDKRFEDFYDSQWMSLNAFNAKIKKLEDMVKNFDGGYNTPIKKFQFLSMIDKVFKAQSDFKSAVPLGVEEK